MNFFNKMFFIYGAIILAAITLFLIVGQRFISPQKALPNVLSHITSSPAISLTPTTQSISSTPVKTMQPKLSKNSYIIALYGDSMIDTISDMPELVENQFTKKYPGVTFTIYNYGIGGQTVADGLGRWDSPFSNRGRTYQPISSIHPDVIIVGSFAYNPFSPHDRERHKNLLSQLVEKAKVTGAQVYMLAEIAPAGPDFGDGPKGVNWSDEQSIEHSNKIIEQIEDVFTIVQSEKVSVIDAYNPSKAPGSAFAQRKYTNADDGIHPSASGHIFTTGIMATDVNLQ